MTGLLAENTVLAGTGYEGRVGLLDREDAESLGDAARWVHRQRGKLLQPAWLAKEIEDAPPGTRWVRVWDLAATAAEEAEHGSSYTAGVLVGLTPDGRVIIGHAVIGRWGAADVEEIVQATAGVMRDGELVTHKAADRVDGRSVPVRFCKERAGAGKTVADRFLRLLAGWDVEADFESGKKSIRLRPFVAQAQAGNVYQVRGPWNEIYRDHMLSLNELPNGDTSRPDDAGDATARGLECLSSEGAWTTPEALAAIIAANPALARGRGQPGGRRSSIDPTPPERPGPRAPGFGPPRVGRGPLGPGRWRL
jgi:predicted phage terminase large subunit-like protein